MKTHVAVYEEGLFDLRGTKLFKGGQMPPLAPLPLKETLHIPNISILGGFTLARSPTMLNCIRYSSICIY